MLRAESDSVKDTVELPLMAFCGRVPVVFASGHGRKATLLLAVILLAGPVCRAVMFKSTSNTTFNTSAPSGALTNSGWQYEGFWNGFLGTPIAPTYFVSAAHIGGTVGDTFTLGTFLYHTTAVFDDPDSDLRVWKVAETFPSYAMLYTNTNEVGKQCVVFGRGTQRGPAVMVSSVTNGWQWGAGDGVKRWGSNSVATVASGGVGFGDLLKMTFDRSATGSNECHLSVGDSGGAMFIQDASNVWRLAGIHYAVDGPFSTTGVNGSGFQAALMDYGGLYTGGDGNWTLQSNTTADKPSGFYSTRISSRVAWINSVIDFQPGTDLRITGIQRSANNMLINFATGTNKVYRVDWRADPATGAWATLTNGIVGTGGIMTATDVGAATLSKRFYRLVLLP